MLKKILFWVVSLPFRLLSTALALMLLLMAVKVGEGVLVFIRGIPVRLSLSPEYVYYMGIPLFLLYLGICVGLVGIAVRVSVKLWQVESFSELLGREPATDTDD